MLDSLFRPRSVAVIGASNRRLTIGYRIIQNLIDHEFNGPIFPVHPKDKCIKNLPAYPTILDVPADVDCAHIVVKNTMVPGVLRDCAKKGVKAAIINTAGFKEIGDDGIKLEQELVAIAKETGIRVFGPNSQGVMNTDKDVRAYCNFTFTKLVPGHVSLFAQSGGVGEVIHNRLYELQAGVRMYASNGNACDVAVPEILRYWGDDPETRVIVCHVESLADPLAFFEAAKEVSKKKPILAMKTGRTHAGARAVSSHTGGLMKQDTTAELLFEESGCLSFRDEEALCQAAYAFSRQPVPRGNRVGIITNTGGPGIISTDELIEAGCAIPDLQPATQATLKAALFPEASVANPVDVLATAGPEHFEAAVKALLDDANVDAILLNFITPFFVDCKGVAEKIAALVPTAQKPIIGIIMTEKDGWADTLKAFRKASIPTYDFPETGSRALAAMVRYAELKARPDEAPPALEGVDAKRAAQILAKAKADGRSFLGQADAFALLDCYGIGHPAIAEAADAAGVVAAAKKVGFPVVLKVDSESVVHKSDRGGVALNLVDEAAVRAAFDKMATAFAQDKPRYLVAQQAKAGREVIFGAKKEGAVGHVVVFGLGGVLVEVLGDVAFGLAPLTRSRAKALLGKIKGRKILEGVRGAKPVDADLLADALCRLGRLVTDNPQIAELDLNPVFVYGEGEKPCAVDVRVKIE